MENQYQGVTESSNIWNNSGCNSEDYKKEETDRNYDAKYLIKSECRVVLKRLNIKVEIEDGKEVILLPDEYKHLNLIKKINFFIPNKTFNRNKVNVQINKDEQNKEHHISKRTKHYKDETNRKRFCFSVKNLNKIQWNIKKKYFKIMCAFHFKEKFTCNLCTQPFTNYKVLRAHLFFHIGNKPFQCTTCNQMFYWEFVLRRHNKEHYNKMQMLQKSLEARNIRIFEKTTSPKFFIKPVEQSKPFECEICGKRIISQSQLKKHYKTHSSYICSICQREFKHISRFRNHLVTHSEDRPFKCNVCNKRFKTKTNLINHAETHRDEYEYFCILCVRGFKTRKCFKTHIEAHDDEYKYSCDICGRSFKRKHSLVNHKLIHNNRSYFCEVCNTSFKTRRGLKTHVRIHSNEYKYTCEICDRGFKTTSCLNVHKLVHSKERKQFCEICGQTFRHKSALTRHRLLQHKVGK
ncbi:zinc finger protein 43-like isoform X1 [Centruroides sculpturatus]|uniref:zinc finger protein 43-like isoform X1 n=1 Tax=Centruroides sculpturatus TaxID=218467 RepID=UPI000C6CA9F2|nr:zinc finger protein 43-like isoform X1 [Centruroides sculpturatus]XP_023239220.1 zinc finger protein 43-like isoform X1 [Centruroides sculpturatus]XP_023239221.1 zinc finger protein 43-like isoform X1 [Centruroides sculpturatus]XP_023239222.1 zinc finger protein 43-like isoform X1 [Centruroides sculpturatus]XP_023239223.1 zinc finger protein 43-like isoform X1 [Centruroides sculpturatus]